MRQNPLILLFLAVLLLLPSNIIGQRKKSTARNKSRQTVLRDPVEVIVPERASADRVQTSGRQFVSEEGGFRVDFPVKPTRSAQKVGSGVGAMEIVQYQVITPISLYMVMYNDNPQVPTDPETLKFLYDAARDRIKAGEGRKLIVESDFYTDKFLGREMIHEYGGDTSFHRMVLVGSRLYQPIIGMRGRYSTATAAMKAVMRKNADKFFATFEVTEKPPPAAPTAEMPQSFGVEVGKGVFKSDYLGFSFDLPKDWIVFSKEESDLLKQSVRENTNITKPQNRELLKLSLDRTRILVVMTTDPAKSATTASLAVGAENLGFSNFDINSAIKNIEQFAVQREGKTITLKPEIVTINGVKFARLENYQSELKIKQRLYLANIKGLALEFVFTYSNEADLEVMEQSLRTVSFKN